MKKIMMLAAMLAMVFAAAAPAVAQDVDASDNDLVDDDSVTSTSVTDNSEDNDQLCAPVVTQYNAIVQGGAGAASLGDGDAVAAAANEAGVSNEVAVTCINGDVTTGVVVEGGDDAAAGVAYEDAGSDDAAAAGEEAAAAAGESASASYSVLPDTGGASLIALGAGALLVAGGLVARRIVR